MKLGVRLHLVGLLLSDTISILYILGVDHCRSTVHNWVQKAELQPLDGANPDHVAVDETVIQLNDERYWLTPMSIPKQTACSMFASFRREHRRLPRCSPLNFTRNISSTTHSFSSTERRGCRRPATVTGSDSSMKPTGIGTVSNVYSEK